jgi:hypothetical protein
MLRPQELPENVQIFVHIVVLVYSMNKLAK